MDKNSLAHTRWECKYHVVFAPKYRRQVIYKDVKADIIAWLPKIKKSGWLILHDFDNPSFPGVRQAIENIFKEGTIMEVEPCDYIAAVRV